MKLENIGPVGKVGTNMRKERIAGAVNHNTHDDPICRANCLDVCISHNDTVAANKIGAGR